jgi:1-acyl-sn-glycerol-3-phosphate acyltransferase
MSESVVKDRQELSSGFVPSAEQSGNDSQGLPVPTTEELAVLSPFERLSFHFVSRMNRGGWKRFWTWCQKIFGAGWIHLSTYNIMSVYGLEYVEAAAHDRPLLLVANHRSFFDMYVVSTTLFRHTKWRKQLFFPVRGRLFYQSPLGLFLNFVFGWW